MLLLVGLGNPGARYVDTRHNVGFRVVEIIARRHGFVPWRQRFQGLACTGTIAGEQISLLLPGTFMNESGRAVAEAVKLLKLSHNEVTVFHDDIERRPGNVKVKIGGGERGHNGLRSITNYIGKEYRRVQIGVGRPELKSLVEAYVLSRLGATELAMFNVLAEVIAENVNYLVAGQDELFEREVATASKAFG
jgi:PTH1 family peptidyl-tRNA hydrolase